MQLVNYVAAMAELGEKGMYFEDVVEEEDDAREILNYLLHEKRQLKCTCICHISEMKQELAGLLKA